MMDFNLDDILSDAPKESDLPNWKKYLIIAGVTAAFIILLIIIIVAIATSSGGSKGNTPTNKVVIGQIICDYKITDTRNPTKLLGDEFNGEGNVDITIDKQKIKFQKEYFCYL